MRGFSPSLALCLLVPILLAEPKGPVEDEVKVAVLVLRLVTGPDLAVTRPSKRMGAVNSTVGE